MSSLGISLLLLLVVAIALVIGYNLRQGAWPRWQHAFRRLLEDVRSRGRAARLDPLRRREVDASPNGRRGAERGEPRLGGGAPENRPAPMGNDVDADDFGARDAATVPVDSGAVERNARPVRPDVGDERDFDGHAPERTSGDRRTQGSPAEADSRSDAQRARSSTAPNPPSPPSAPLAPAAPSASPAAVAASAMSAAAETASSNPIAAGAGDERGTGSPAQPAPAGTTIGAAASGPALSEACDCIVELAPASPLAGERLLAIAQRLRRAGSKPVAFDARARAGDDGFELPVPGRTYELVRVGVLLANRHGPLNAMEFSEFVSAVQAMAESLSARAEMPAMGSVLARARDLDSTCAQLDVQIGVNVEAPEAVEPAQLAALAPTLGLVERGSHRYVRQGPQGEPLFSLGFSDSPSRLTFLLDVPRVAASLEPFGRMVQAAGTCAQRLGARLVDDSGKPLAQASLAQIARQLDQRYESLEAIGLPAGSTLACKVFN